MRRLYSTFARGGPGVGLLLMRLVAGITAIADGVAHLQSSGSILIDILAIIGGILLLAGLWVPISGSMVGTLGIWDAISGTSDFRAGVLLATFGIALVLLGPGVWSVDARLFGWKRIDLHGRDR